MSFSDEEDDEFDLLPLPDVDFAALDLSSYTVVPSQAAFRPPPPHVVKRERGLPADEEWDIPIRVGQDGTYGLKVSPIKGTSAPPPAARPPPPAPVVHQQQQQQQPTADAYPASQQQIPLSQAAATRRAAALAYAASTSTGAGPSASASTRGQSAPPVQPAGRLVGGFSQRPLGPPPFVPPQATARAGSVGPAARGAHLGQGPARPGLRAGSRGPTPGPTSRGPSPVPSDGASARLQVDSDLAALRRQNEELVKALKEKEDAFFTANGEASMLRRRMEEADKHNREAMEALKAQHEAAEEKRRRKEEERRIDEEARKTKAVLENHNAATYSVRRPAAAPPSSHNWGTQSVLRPRPRPSQQPSSQRRSGSLFGQVAQTPAPVGRSAGREMILRSGGSGSRSAEKGSPKGKEREAYAQSPQAARLRQEATSALPPPVPKFTMFHNTFANGAAGAGGSANRRASGVKAGLGGLYKTASQQRSPSKAPADDGQHERDAKKRRTSNPRSDGDRSDGVGVGDRSGDVVEEEEEETTPRASQKHRPLSTSSPVPDSDEGEAGAEMPMDIDSGVGPAEEAAPPEDVEDDDDYWRLEEKEILFAVLFNHQIAPLSTPAPASAVGPTQLTAPSPSTPMSLVVKNPTIQAVLAPLDPSSAATARDRSEHARASARILGALGGADAGRNAVLGGDLVIEVLKGLQAMAKLFERLSLLPLLADTLLLIRSLVLHLPRAGHVLLRLPSFISLITAIKERHLPVAVASPKGRKGATTTAAAGDDVEDTAADNGRDLKLRVTRAMLSVVEVVVWQAEGQADADVLGTLIQVPNYVSSLLDAAAQPPDIIAQMVRILKLASFFESLFRPLLAFPDPTAQVRGRDATRIPLVDLLCKLLRDPPAGSSDAETLAMSLDIIDIFHTLCYKHPDDAVLLFGQQRSLTPTLVICLEQASNAIWGVDPSLDEMRRSIPGLVPTLQLLSLLTSPEEPALAHTTKLADRLRSAPKTDFPAAFERFMVAFGRICYAEMPDLEALAAWGVGGEPKGSETWRIWEGELERAGDIARDIFDQVVEGPEGDLVYGVFVLEPDEETESLASSAVVNGHEHPADDENGAPPPSSQPLGPLMPEEGDEPGVANRGGGGSDDDSETEDDESVALPALPPLSKAAAVGSASQIRKSGRIKARAVPRQEVVKPPPRRPVEVVELSDSE